MILQGDSREVLKQFPDNHFHVVATDKIFCGDALEVLKTFPDNFIDCCICSPPYYGLRDYGIDGQIGLETTPYEYVAKMVEVFREVRRVLKKEGTLWLNLGDSYAGSWGNYHPNSSPGKHGQRLKNTARWDRPAYEDKQNFRPPTSNNLNGLKPKDLIGIPWRVAFALQADGWYLRSDIIWAKNNPMPESVTDRPTKAHEYVFLLAKSKKYYYDNEAIKEESVTNDPRRPYTSKGAWELDGRPEEQKHSGEPRATGDFTKRNRRSVWQINTKPFKEAHFAVMPEALVEPCVLAGTSERGVCPACGKAWVRQVERNNVDQKSNEVIKTDGVPGLKPGTSADRVRKLSGSTYKYVRGGTIGWLPSCSCDLPPRPAIVLDPFFGAGTVGVVSQRLGRHWIGIDLNPAYNEIARKRIAAVPVSLSRFAEG